MSLKTDFQPCLMSVSLERSSLGTAAPDCVAVQGTTPWTVWIIPVTPPKKSVVRSTEIKAAIPKVVGPSVVLTMTHTIAEKSSLQPMGSMYRKANGSLQYLETISISRKRLHF